MARGGARPGAGRPRKSAVTPATVAAKPAAKPRKQTATVPAPAPTATLPADVTQPAADAGMTPLDYMLSVMRDPNQDPMRRDRMAMAAAPFVHIRPADAKPGKKEDKQSAAKTAAAGKFAPSAPPLKLVGNR